MPDATRIPGLYSLLDASGDAVCDCLEGNIPVIISAPHAGYTRYSDGTDGNDSPSGALKYGTRVSDPSGPTIPGAWFNIGGFNTNSDINTRHVVIGIIRRFLDAGLRPYAVINRVLRSRMDMARPWELQHRWSNGGAPLTSAQIGSSDPQFRRTYHTAYHDQLAEFVQRLDGQGGWLFDIHGRGTTNQVVVSTTAGWMARSDWVYLDGSDSFFERLEQESLNPVAHQALASGVDGLVVNYIPGLLHGATDPFAIPTPRVERTTPIVPQTGRVHGVHVEVEGDQRIPTSTGTKTQQIREVEALGARVGNAIFGFLDAHDAFDQARVEIARLEGNADEGWYATAG